MYKCRQDQVATWTSKLKEEDGLWRRVYTNSDEIGTDGNSEEIENDKKIDDLKKDMTDLRSQYIHYR